MASSSQPRKQPNFPMNTYTVTAATDFSLISQEAQNWSQDALIMTTNRIVASR